MRKALLAFVLMVTPALATAAELLPTHIHTHTGKTITLMLETARDEASRERGLMFRKTLKPADGMAFFFPHSEPYQFWMKNTLIPLDMLFVDEAGRIVYITTAKPLSLSQVGPKSPVNTVIEIAGGRAAHEGISVGDKVQYGKPTHTADTAH